MEFVDRVLKVDDPVGAISVHGANGLWGVISVGLFADGKSNYGGSWNGVNGSVTGLFYGDAEPAGRAVDGRRDAGRLRLHLQLRRQPGRSTPSSASASARRPNSKVSIFPKWDSSAIPSSSSRPDGRGSVEMTAELATPTAVRHELPAGSLARPSHGLAGGARADTSEPGSGLRAESALGRPADLPRHGSRHELRRLQVDGRAGTRRSNWSRTTSSRS